MEQLAKEFASNWKDVLAKINTDVMNFFPNFELGSDILKQVHNHYFSFSFSYR